MGQTTSTPEPIDSLFPDSVWPTCGASDGGTSCGIPGCCLVAGGGEQDDEALCVALELLEALRAMLSACEFLVPDLDVLTGTDSIACAKEKQRAIAMAKVCIAKAEERLSL